MTIIYSSLSCMKFKFKRLYFLLVLILFANRTSAQKDEDNVIIVRVTDTANLYNRVRQAVTYTDLIIREDSKKDTLITYSERIGNTTIFIIAKIVLKRNVIEISGAFGLGLENFWGYPAWPKSYKRINYFKGSEGWKVLRRIAIKLDSKMEFARED
jgi:hypothetical protein